MSNTTSTISIERIDAALSMLTDLNESMSDIVAAYEFCRQAGADLNRVDCFDPQTLSEITDLVVTINRLNYMEEARLKHLKMMRECELKAAEAIEAQKEAARARAEARKAVTLVPSSINTIQSAI